VQQTATTRSWFCGPEMQGGEFQVVCTFWAQCKKRRPMEQ
jgi:hypothetical protein